LHIAVIARQPAPNLDWCFAFRQDRNAMMRTLPVPDSTVAGACDRPHRKFRIVCFQFLEAYDVGTRLSEPFE
jgi:hypothetical protein